MGEWGGGDPSLFVTAVREEGDNAYLTPPLPQPCQMESVFFEHGQALCEVMAAKAASGEVVDMQMVFASLTFDTMCEIAFGVSAGALKLAAKGEKCAFLVAFDAAQTICSERFLSPHPAEYKLRRFFGIGSEGKLPGHVRTMDSFLQGIVDARHAEMSMSGEAGTGAKGATSRGDLLSLFISHAHQHNKPEMLTDAYLKNMIVNFMIAGRDTTSCALTNIFKMLPRNEEAQRSAVQECDALYATAASRVAEAEGGSGRAGAQPAFDAFNTSMPVADACFNESLRMFPPVGNDIVRS